MELIAYDVAVRDAIPRRVTRRYTRKRYILRPDTESNPDNVKIRVARIFSPVYSSIVE